MGAGALLDVRAPAEFERGALPGAINAPILEDHEREQIGICYRNQGSEAAVALGHQLVSGAVRTGRIDRWRKVCDQQDIRALYCWRGGMRSSLAQQWLQDTGIELPRIEGGFKALRHHLIDAIEHGASELPLLLVAGRTGSGKTAFLHQFDMMIDLEGLAGHRGSAFGSRPSGQPMPIDFEHAVAIEILRQQQRKNSMGHSRRVLIEDEGRLVGRLGVPLPLQAAMKQAPVVVIDAPLEERIEVIRADYICGALEEHQQLDPTGGFGAWSQSLLDALDRIRKRLGGDRHAAIRALLEQALEAHAKYGNDQVHHQWIGALLSSYYDPMYDYQLDGKADRIAFRGNHADVSEWLVAQGHAARTEPSIQTVTEQE